MLRKFIEKLALPGVIAAIAAGAALAAADGNAPVEAPSGALTALAGNDVRIHAENLFHQADLDKDGDLDVDEFTALSVVLAELSRLNGYVAILSDNGRAAAPIAPGPAMNAAERIRIEAVAARERAIAAGGDGRLDVNEYIDFELNRFSVADRNRNGVLSKGELLAYAHQTARIPSLNG